MRISVITFALLLGALLFGQQLIAQKTVVLPLEVSYYNDYDQPVLDKRPTFVERLTAHLNAVPDTTAAEQLRVPLQRVLDKSARPLGGAVKTLHLDDMDEELQAAYQAARGDLALAYKGGFLNGKRYDDMISTKTAPFLNQLCDAFDADRVVLVKVTAENELPLKLEGKKDPKGILTVDTRLFDGNSGLVLKQKVKRKGDSENVRVPYKLTEEMIAKQLEDALKRIL